MFESYYVENCKIFLGKNGESSEAGRRRWRRLPEQVEEVARTGVGEGRRRKGLGKRREIVFVICMFIFLFIKCFYYFKY